MSLELLVAVAQITGSVAVVVTVAVLALQVRENTKTSRMTGQQMVNDGWIEVAHLVAQDAEITRIYREGMKDLSSLGPDDQWRFGALMQIVFASSQNAFLFGDEIQKSRMNSRLADNFMLRQPGPRQWWPRAKDLYHPQFQAYMDQRLEDFALPTPRAPTAQENETT